MDALGLAVELGLGGAPGLVTRLAQRALDPERLDLARDLQQVLDLRDLCAGSAFHPVSVTVCGVGW